ncbi:CYTH domain-containing protein [Ditylenchus destructor]|uniref:CYTH domain-containing protein n=1 Tax=Ditylenchus destructor TaxID=166010 RepID=A0AAD4R5Z3_9BILA|nr:CYTH domain-containing protein [Ditylenchus destructor]
MPRNVEVKAKVEDLKQLLDKSADLCEQSQAEVLKQHDTFFNSPNGRQGFIFKNVRNNQSPGMNAFRLKLREFVGTDGPSELIFYDRPDEEGPKISDFVKASIEDAKSLKEALRKSMGIKGELKKTRHLFIKGQTRIHVDQVEGLGDFMELEVCLKDDQDLSEGQRIADALLEKLGIPKSALISGAYIDALTSKDS